MPQPLVSVIVPAYNAAGFISRCVESITSQSYPELEILLLNDGSTDDTLAVCRKLAAADSRIRVVDKPNTGAADTRSCGLALAHGEYIQFADSDDHLLPGCTANLVAAMQRSHADLVLAPYRMMVPRKDGGYDTREYSLLPAGVYNKVDYLWQLTGNAAAFYYGVLWNKLYRRDLIQVRACGIRRGPAVQHPVSAGGTAICRHRRSRLLLHPEPAERMPYAGERGGHAAPPQPDVPHLQGNVYPAGRVR